MILTCPECTISYELPVTLPEEGRKVRCAKCSHVWVAKPDDEPMPALAERPAPLPVVDVPAEPVPEPEAFEDIEAEQPMAGDDISFKELDEAETVEAEEVPAPAEEDQSSIDALFDQDPAPEDSETNDQAGIDSLFDVAEEPEGEPQSQSGIDDLMAAASEEPSPEDQLFTAADAPAPPAMEPQPEVPSPELTGAPEAPQAPIPSSRDDAQKKNPYSTHILAGWGALAASLLVFAGYTYFNSEGTVRNVPGTAKFYEAAGTPVNVRGLEFRGVSYNWENDGGKPVLHVKGSVVNVTDKTLSVPTVVFALRDDKGSELLQWTKNVYEEPLSGGQSATFDARIPSPPPSVRSLQVRFAKVETR